MNVLLISQCSGRALNETRRILDQFGERRGDRAWQTPITRQGLDALRRLLKKTARRNTAVACHWIRGRDRSELIWIVGSARRFNAEGAVPTNTTTRDMLRADDENDWHTAEVIRLLAKLAALFHDLGKACHAFQKKLKSRKAVRDAYRHEWVSLRLFQAFVSGDDDEIWLARLACLLSDRDPRWLDRLLKDGIIEPDPATRAFGNLPPLAKAVGWLIVSHHFLPTSANNANVKRLKNIPEIVDASWNRANPEATDTEKQTCWAFNNGTPFASASWCADVRRVAQRMLRRNDLIGKYWLNDPYVAHLSRLCLMLSDHYYSSQPSDATRGDAGFPLYANTDADGSLKQRLDEHLIGVGVHAGNVARQLPRITRDMPRLVRHKGFTRRSKDRCFAWQDRAFDLASSLRTRAAKGGFFGVNLASTGCGKTLANGRILYALADPQRGARISIGLGLRTLTLQTGEAYRRWLRLGPDDLAVRVGGGAVKDLFERAQKQQSETQETDRRSFAQRGSESAEPMFDENEYVHYEGSLPDGPLKHWLAGNPEAQKLINAPILVSTIDHLIPATEGTRGGRQIAPMLRLMSSDLVLDEPDDFGLEDLPALTRMVHWAGLLGSRVLLSSATLPPAMVRGLFVGYLEGRRVYQCNRGILGQPLSVCCAWFDENGVASGDHGTAESFAEQHRTFVDRRVAKLARESPVRRKAVIHPTNIAPHQCRELVRQQWADGLRPLIQSLHRQHHSADPTTGRRVSFGLIRMAHIDPLIDTALALFAGGADENQRIHLCCYHSQHPLLIRSAIEQRLDRLLNRVDSDAIFHDSELRGVLDERNESDQIFVVLATPVAEVGRDHDYDWAIVEPSSMRSIIQLAGRVMRHRLKDCEQPNIILLDTNLDALEKSDAPAYCRPGFEDKRWRLSSHRLTDILLPEQYERIDSTPRISERSSLTPQANLVDLEHARLRALMLGEGVVCDALPVTAWWETRAHLSGILQFEQRFREENGPRNTYVFMPDEDGEKTVFKSLESYAPPIEQSERLRHIEIKAGCRIEPWGVVDYLTELDALADQFEITLERAALRFGIVDLPERDQGWRYDPVLGLGRYLT